MRPLVVRVETVFGFAGRGGPGLNFGGPVGRMGPVLDFLGPTGTVFEVGGGCDFAAGGGGALFGI